MPELFSSLTPLNLRRVNVANSGFVDAALRNLVEAAQTQPLARARFAMYRWKTLEDKANTKNLKEAVRTTLGYTMKNAEAEVIMSRYRTHEDTFDYSAFLISFLNAYDTYTSREVPNTPPLSPKRDTTGILRNAVRRVSHVVAASQQLNDDGENAALRRAKEIVEEALRVRIIKQCSEYKENIGNISLRSFMRKMNSLYDAILTEREATALFNYLDSDHDGIIAETEFIQYIYSVENNIRHQLSARNPNIIKRRIKRQASNCMCYDRKEFKRAVVLLTQSLKTGRKLNLPVASLPQQVIRKQLYEQLGVKLTRLQMQCLCYKLQRTMFGCISECSSTESEATTVVSFGTNISSNSIIASIPSVSAEEIMRELPIEGIIVEKFYYQLQRYFTM